MTEYKPGTVAKATVRGVPDVTVMRSEGHYPWRSERLIDDAVGHYDGDVTDVRPLVVLDLGEYDGCRAVTYLRNLARDSRDINGTSPSPRGKLANFIADQIEKQLRPAIEEPKGLGAVVEDRDALWWVRNSGGIDGFIWQSGNARRRWDDVNAVRVLSFGVTP